MIDKIMRVDSGFEKELEDIRFQRIKNGIDIDIKDIKSMRRITKAIRRHKMFPQIKDDIINAELREDLNIQ